MEIFIYYKGKLETPIDEIEDALNDGLSEIEGEVTGVGRGEMGGNIDLEVNDSTSVDQILSSLRQIVGEFNPGVELKVVINEESHVI